jgi:hypothetical protein
MIQE